MPCTTHIGRNRIKKLGNLSSNRKAATVLGHLDNLIEQVEAGNKSSRGEGHWVRGCQLGSTYIGRNSAKLVSKDFDNGVMKIQGGGTSQLTDDEKAAVATLRKDGKVAAKLKDDGNDSEDEDDSEDGGVSLQ
jgi:hypothetical protein